MLLRATVDGPLTETIISSWFAHGTSDEYGIDAHRLNITKIESFGRQQCNKVKELDLSFNGLKRVNCLEQIPSLQVLKLHANQLKEIDDYDIPKGSNIEILYLSGNQLGCVPKVIGTLRKLRELRLDSNQILGSPVYESMYSCRKLTYLNLSRNKITSVKGIESIGTLETLVLASNEIETLHPNIRRLDNLQELDLSGNRLSTINSLQGARKLSVLRVADNRISSWKDVPYISTLTEFHASGNRLTRAPAHSSDHLSSMLDVLDIGNNRIDEMNNLTSIVQFNGLISLRVEGNPVCREDRAIVQTLVNEMPNLLVIDGIDASIYGGGKQHLSTPRSVIWVVEQKERRRKNKEEEKEATTTTSDKDRKMFSSSSSPPLKKSPPKNRKSSSSSPKDFKISKKRQLSKHSPPSKESKSSLESSTFTLSIANLMLEYNTTTTEHSSETVSSSLKPATLPDTSNHTSTIVPLLHVSKSQVGTQYGLRRPLSARGSGPMSPRTIRPRTIQNSTGISLQSVGGDLDLTSVNRPVARAASLRTGRGTGLKRLDNVEDMAKTFRKTIASERTILMTCAPTPEDEARNSDCSDVMSTVVGGDARLKLKAITGSEGQEEKEVKVGKEEDSDEAKKNNNVKRSRTFGRSRRQNRSLKAALEYSREGKIGEIRNCDTSTNESASNKVDDSSSAISPTNSISTVTDASPSPTGSNEDCSSTRVSEEASSKAKLSTSPGGWSSRPSSARTREPRNAQPSLSKTMRRKQRRGFGNFRVPNGAKSFVNKTLIKYEKEAGVEQKATSS
jgi:Leucine-rich repeat (LRR) protein